MKRIGVSGEKILSPYLRRDYLLETQEKLIVFKNLITTLINLIWLLKILNITLTIGKKYINIDI